MHGNPERHTKPGKWRTYISTFCLYMQENIITHSWNVYQIGCHFHSHLWSKNGI